MGYCWTETHNCVFKCWIEVQTKSEENVSLPGKPVISYGLRSRVPLGNVASKLNNAKGIKTNVIKILLIHFHYGVVQFLVQLLNNYLHFIFLRNRRLFTSNQLNVSRAPLKESMLFRRRTLGLATVIWSDRWDFKERRLKLGLAVVRYTSLLFVKVSC